MNPLGPGLRTHRLFARCVLSSAQILLMIPVMLGLLFRLRVGGLGSKTTPIDSLGELQRALQHGFAGFGLILIGLALIETLRAYLHGQPARLDSCGWWR